MKTVNEVSKITGVSVRTLHHYDAIGLLKPTKVTEAGYRLYDVKALERLQNILFYRELEFPLKEIKKILDSPDFNVAEALEQQIELLEMQYKRMEKIISLAREIQRKGNAKMTFDVFDKKEIEKYKKEAKEKWGNTGQWQEYEAKQQGKESFKKEGMQMMNIFKEIGNLRHLLPADDEVQKKIEQLKSFITENYYTCTNEILESLGQMYVADERFKENIDRAGGEGTAVFTAEAIKVYCTKA